MPICAPGICGGGDGTQARLGYAAVGLTRGVPAGITGHDGGRIDDAGGVHAAQGAVAGVAVFLGRAVCVGLARALILAADARARRRIGRPTREGAAERRPRGLEVSIRQARR